MEWSTIEYSVALWGTIFLYINTVYNRAVRIYLVLHRMDQIVVLLVI